LSPCREVDPHASPGRRGFTLVETLLVVLLLAIVLVPVLNAFWPVWRSGDETERTTLLAYRAEGALARLTALPFAQLRDHIGDPADMAALFDWSTPPTADELAEEQCVFRGQTNRISVSILDASRGAGGLLELRATCGGITLRTLKAEY
jgi:prepilin-type N-terminal cleavage/methylation domain-containing protein